MPLLTEDQLAAIQYRVLDEVKAERVRQDAKFGSQRHLPHDRWLCILGEEFGEVARAILEQDSANLYEELIQVAAVAVAWAEAMYVA